MTLEEAEVTIVKLHEQVAQYRDAMNRWRAVSLNAATARLLDDAMHVADSQQCIHMADKIISFAGILRDHITQRNPHLVPRVAEEE